MQDTQAKRDEQSVCLRGKAGLAVRSRLLMNFESWDLLAAN